MIITNNEEALRVVCSDVSANEVGELVEILERELAHSNRMGVSGIGLAAPQIGIAKNIAIIRLGQSKDLDINLVNCKIINQYDPIIFRSEACLSFPGKVEDTTRFQEVHITTNLVESYDFVATGFLAIACQHEIDHLNGKLFFDYAIKKSEVIKTIKAGPNDKCPCNSGKKYKKCCGR